MQKISACANLSTKTIDSEIMSYDGTSKSATHLNDTHHITRQRQQWQNVLKRLETGGSPEFPLTEGDCYTGDSLAELLDFISAARFTAAVSVINAK